MKLVKGVFNEPKNLQSLIQTLMTTEAPLLKPLRYVLEALMSSLVAKGEQADVASLQKIIARFFEGNRES